MLKMSIPVVVESVNASKEGAKHAGYANFLFTGGEANIPVNVEQLKQLEVHNGDDVVCEFEMYPRGVVEFGRSVCSFRIRNFIRIMPGQGGK